MNFSGLLIGHAVGWSSVILFGVRFIETGIGRPEWRHFTSIFDYAKHSWLGGLKNRMFNDIDILILGAFVPTQLVGIYSIAWKIASFLMTFDAAISQTVFPEISNASADDMTESVTGLTNESLRFSGLILIPGLVGGMLLSNRLLRIYSPEFMRGSLVLVILILSTLLYGYQRQLLTSLNAVDRPDITFQVNAALIGFNILANTALISTIGWIGAAIATTLSAALGASLAYGGLRRVMDFSVPLASICLQVAASFIMGIVVYGALQIEKSYSFLNNNIMITMMLVTLGAVVYFTVLFAISLEFRKTIRRNLFIDS
jgi:O-antigen/teichoic acid export membrane protein